MRSANVGATATMASYLAIALAECPPLSSLLEPVLNGFLKGQQLLDARSLHHPIEMFDAILNGLVSRSNCRARLWHQKKCASGAVKRSKK